MVFYGCIAVLVFVCTVILGRIGIPLLKSIKMGQKILDIGPRWHKGKEGTPTMGGLFFIIPIVVGGILLSLMYDKVFFVHTAFILVTALIGFVDDLAKFTKKQNAGLSPTQKLILQFVSSAAYIVVLYFLGKIDTTVVLPFSWGAFTLPLWVYAVISTVGIVFTTNSTNLTDGIDGLASTVTTVVMILLATLSYRLGNMICFAFCGMVACGTLGFLVYNFYPAKVFMGDTGSLFLGACISVVAFILDLPFLLLFVGIVYFIESFSVMIQVSSYKLTKKRVFKMAPIHHHFEMCGWSEIKIVTIFSLVALIIGAIGVTGYII